MKKILCVVIVCVIVSVTIRIASARDNITIDGTGDSQKLMRILAKTFEKSHPNTKVEIPDSIGSGGGVKATAYGKSDLGRIARPIREKEKKYNLNSKFFAYSPVVFVTNPSVTGINNLSSQQIIGIYSGKISFWSELGGEKRKIYVANREAGDSSREVLERVIPWFNDTESLAGEIVYSTPETLQIIKKHRDTIGYLPLSMVKGTNLIVMKVDGIYPSVENVQKENYNLISSFGIIWKGKLSGLSKAFVDFLFSAEAQKIMLENGTIPVLPEK